MEENLLLQKIEKKRKSYKADSLSMSIGEIANLYVAGEIILDPQFQRYFRWSTLQKSRLIESILLGIPIPPVFVYQKEDGLWEVVDGLQRISTLLQFMGKLKNENPLTLVGTKHLPELDNVVYESNEEDKNILPESLKMFLRRARLDFIIISSDSSGDAKYEVFQRLNTGGSIATPQEVRNCIMIMIDPVRFNRLYELSQNEDFLSTISLSHKLLSEQYNIELVLRYLACLKFNYDAKYDVADFITNSMESIMLDDEFDLEYEEKIFKELFKMLNSSIGENAFKKFDGEKFKGNFLVSAFETITVGIGYNITKYNGAIDLNRISKKIEKMWTEPEFLDNMGSGTNARNRIPKLIPFGKKYFSNE